MTRRGRRVLTAAGILVAVGLVGAVSYGVARAAARPSQPRYPSPDGATAPLRPAPLPAGAPPPGPLASRLGALMTKLSDEELQATRFSLPSHWWSHITLATAAPDDAYFTFLLAPFAAELAAWSPEQRQQLQSDLVASMGLSNALTLQAILQEAGVL